MSVVIKMDMPKSCGMCECSGTGVCREWMKVDRRDMGSKRAVSCPILCELPEKHGRLIDADDFLNFLKALTDNGASYQSVIELLEKSETIIEAEGKHDGK